MDKAACFADTYRSLKYPKSMALKWLVLHTRWRFYCICLPGLTLFSSSIRELNTHADKAVDSKMYFGCGTCPLLHEAAFHMLCFIQLSSGAKKNMQEINRYLVSANW